MSLATASSPSMLRKPPAAAMLPLLLVFLCGITVGALAMSFVIHNVLHRTSTPVDVWTKQTVSKWRTELNLTVEQQRELESTLDDFSKYYDNVLADGKTRIMSILDEGQRRKLERMLQGRKP